MKSIVTIENGKSKIVLFPENVFEERICEDLYNEKSTQELVVYPDADYKMCSFENHKLVIEIKDVKK